jgi:hypothetical protein
MIGDVQNMYILYKKFNHLKYKGTSWNRDTKHKGCIVLYQSINGTVIVQGRLFRRVLGEGFKMLALVGTLHCYPFCVS